MNTLIVFKISKGRLLSIVTYLLFLAFSSSSHAFPLFEHAHHGIDAPDFGFLHSNSSYDANTNVYSAIATDPRGLVPGESLPQDFTGSLNLLAEITNDGDLVDGTIAFVGGSSALGIAPGTILMTGNLVDFGYGIILSLAFQFVVDVTFSDSRIGFDQFAGMTFFHGTSLARNTDLFQDSFTGDAYTYADLQALHVPEPSALILFGLGIVVLSFTQKFRHKHKSEQFSQMMI